MPIDLLDQNQFVFLDLNMGRNGNAVDNHLYSPYEDQWS